MPPNTSDPYAFILNNPAPGEVPSHSKNSKARLIIVAVCAVLLIIIIALTISLFSGGSGEQKQRLVRVAQAQTEIVRIASLADEKTENTNTKTYAKTVKNTLQSEQIDIVSFLKKRRVKVNEKILSAGKNTDSDSALDEAASNNNFDSAFVELIKKQLVDYQKLLKSAYDSSTDKEKAVLKDDFDQVVLLF